MDTDEHLMQAFQAGRPEAFDELFARYREPVWGFFRRRVADPERARELAQDTFVAVLQGARRYEPRAAFRSYVFGIAFNILAAARRQQPREVTLDPGSMDPPASPSNPDEVLWVREAIAGLDAADREILMLREYECLSYDEIATLVGIPLNTVRSRLFRARGALRERLAGDTAPILKAVQR